MVDNWFGQAIAGIIAPQAPPRFTSGEIASIRKHDRELAGICERLEAARAELRDYLNARLETNR